MASEKAEPPLGTGTLIVTPTYDERDNLGRFVEQTLAVAPGAHVLVVDDASPDGTGALADSLAAADPRVRVLHRSSKRGLGTAYVEAFTQNLDAGYTHFFEMDTDLSHDPADLPAFFARFAAGADVVVGSRNVPGGGVRGWGPVRHLVSKGGSLYARTILGVAVRDLTTGFKAYTREAIGALDLSTVSSNGYSFQVETTYRALRAGLRVDEVPIVFVDRRVGKSKMSYGIFLEAVVMVWRLRLGR